MKRPNPLDPNRMSAAERRAELCGLLALGLVRLRVRKGQLSDRTGDIRLHYPAGECRHANATQRETSA